MDSLLTEKQKARIISFIEKKEYDKIISLLQPLKTAHAGTPKTRDKRFVVKEIVKKIKKDANPLKEFFETGKYFCDIDDPMCKQFGVSLIRSAYTYKPAAVKKYLLKTADDGNWEVRESAGGAFASVLSAHPDFYAQLTEWAKHPSENVRRAVVIAAIGLRESKQAGDIDKAFKLLKPLMYDSSRYVKKNLGPFVLGSYFGNSFPEKTFLYLEKWTAIKDEHMRWNIAMSFANSFGNKYPEKALRLLALLAEDERKTVRRAVISALRFLNKRYSGAVQKFTKEHNLEI